MKITKDKLKQIIKEEVEKVKEDQGVKPEPGIFNANYLYDFFYDELTFIEAGSANVSPEAFQQFESAVVEAIAMLKRDLLR